MDDANGYSQQNNSQASFEQSFMQSVNQQPQQPSVGQFAGKPVESPKRNNKPIVVGIIVLAMVVIGGAIALFIIRNRDDEEYIPPITDDELDGSADEGSWKMRDDDGNVIAVRMTCSTDERKYSFFKDGSYILTIDDESTSEGTYTIGDGTMRIFDDDGNFFDAQYDFENFSINGESYSCREFNDA